MKLSKIEQVNEFLSIVDSCKGDVTLRSFKMYPIDWTD